MRKIILISLFFLICFNLKSQIYFGRFYLGKKHCTEVLKRHMTDSLYTATANRIIARKNRTLKNKRSAIKLIEPVLFKKYGEIDTKDERPYEVYLINGFWLVKGTLKRNSNGGTFISVIDSKTGEIIFTLHTK